MYSQIKKIDTPQIFFKHELDGMNWRSSSGKFFAFYDENGKLADKQLFVPFGLNDKNVWGLDIISIKLAVEERYSQNIIDSCKKEHKKYDAKQHEWHLVLYPCVINVKLGKIVYQSDDSFNEHIYIYDNLICICKHSTWVKVLDMNGNVLWDKGETYGSSYQHLINTKDRVILVTSHDYKENIDKVHIFNKQKGTIETIY